MKHRQISLGKKAVFAIMVMVAVLISTAVFISYRFYSNTMDEYYKNMTMNVAQTAATAVSAEQVEGYRDAMMEIYNQNPAPEFDTDEAYEEYIAQFDGIKDEGYHELYTFLNDIKAHNDVLYLYICYMDPASMTGIYLLDVDDSDSACPMGVWDIIYEDNYEAMTHPEDGFAAYVTQSDYGWLSSAGAAILNDEGEAVAHIFVDISMDAVMAERSAFLTQLSLILSGVTALLLLVFIKVMNRSVVKPINDLSHATSDYIQQKDHENSDEVSPIRALDIHTRDEIESLFQSILQMEQDINQYIENIVAVTSEKERLGAELSVATNIQASMLPASRGSFPWDIPVELYATMDPAKEVGGDFYDYFMVDEDHLALVIADVSGKGVPAALFMVVAKTLLKNCAQIESDPKIILDTVNNQLCENNSEELFVTVWIGIYELSTGTLTAANAGHEYPAIRRGNGDFELFKDPHGFVLAGMEDFKYKKYNLDLNAGDTLFVFTDGVTEATSAVNELYGDKRLLTALNSGKECNMKELLAHVRKDINAFVGEAPQFDDITMMGIKIGEKQSPTENI